MDKLAAIRIYDGQDYSDEIPVTALAENIQWDESSTLIDILGSINLTRKGNIQDQIDELNNRINQEAYSKPIDGIPKTDLANSVQISLGKADTALQSYIETDPTVPAWAKQPNKPTYTAQEVGALPADSQITVEVDNTLSIQGAAADAKAVGDALDSISTSVQNIWTGRCTDRFPTVTINKTVVLDNPEGFSLTNGVIIAIKYIGNAETVLNPCLNVNGTGNIPVITGNDSSFGNDKYYLRSWGDEGLHFFMYSALGNNPGNWYLTNVDTKMWTNLIDDFSILQDANVATAQDLGKVPTVKVIRGGQVAEWQYKDITVDNTLNIQGAPADAKKVGDELTQIKQDLEIQQVRAETAQALKINKPVTNPNGTQGQILQTDGQGGTVWVNKQTDEQIADAVTDWLDDHVTPGGSTIVVDDTLSIQGTAADAKKVGDEISDLKEELINVDRVLDISWTLGSINRDNGAITDANDRLRTNMFVGIYPYLRIAKETTNRVILEIFKYNSNGTYVNYQYVVVNDGLTIGYKFDSDYKYIIVSRSTTEQITFTESNGLILWANGSISSGNVNPYSTNTITANEFSVSESCILVVSVPNCRVDLTYYSNGTYVADLSYRDDGNKKAYFLLSPSYTYRLYAYTENYAGVSAELVNIPASQVYIGGMYNGIVISSTENNRSNLINAEHNRYVMIWATVTSVVHKYKNGLYIGTSTAYSGVFSPTVAYIGDCDAFYISTNGLSDIFWILTNDSPLYGKKWCSYGDSITEQQKWQNYLVAKYGLILSNKGLGGSCVTGNTACSVTSMCADSRINDIATDTNIITVMGGTNDFDYCTDIGEISDLQTSYDQSTFIGSVATIVKKLQTRCPNARIILMSNVNSRGVTEQNSDKQQVSTYGYTPYDFAVAMKQVAEWLSVGYIDTWSCGINQLNRSTYVSDSVHPNNDGGKLIANKVIEYFDTLTI